MSLLRRASERHRDAKFLRSFPAIPAVVTACNRNEISGWVKVTCSRLLGSDYEYETEPADGDQFVAHAGVDPGVVNDALVLLVHIEAMADDDAVDWWAIPIWSFPPATFDMPSMTCLTAFTEPCSDGVPTNLCVG